MPMSYRLLCLDAGFTLLTPRQSLAEALSNALSDDGRTITEDEMQAVWDEGDRWWWDEYHRPGNDTWTDDSRIDDYWRRYHGFVLERLGVEARNEVLERLLAGQVSAEAWELYPDVEPMLATVREMGVRIGVVSDWSSSLRQIMAGLGLDRYLDFVLPSGAVGVAKPNPAFFRMALEAVDVAPAEALMVGDSYRADVRGAWAAGIDAVWLDRTEGINITPDDEPAPTDVRVIRSLDELPDIVRNGGPLPRGDVADLVPASSS
jgi:HAD superfamily hydrolase (TIGR01509 family)